MSSDLSNDVCKKKETSNLNFLAQQVVPSKPTTPQHLNWRKSYSEKSNAFFKCILSICKSSDSLIFKNARFED